MRFVGSVCDYLEDWSRVREAIVTKDRVAIDWEEDGERWHVVAHSSDGGRTYRGNYGYDRPNPNWVMELKRYRAPDGAVLLLARWWDRDSGEEAECLFRLDPQPK